MNCHGESTTPETSGGVVILVGNPNVGKSVVFGKLTGRYVTVANYPGTTIELSRGSLPDGTTLIDTPGVNSLNGKSDDERVTCDILFNSPNPVKAVVQVADAKNLQRALMLTLQLATLKIPMVLDLNMLDEVAANGLRIDVERLRACLGIEIVETIATHDKGLDSLVSAIERARPATLDVQFSQPLDALVERLVTYLPAETPHSYATALRLLSGDARLAESFGLNGKLTRLQEEVTAHYHHPPQIIIAQERFRRAQSLLDGVITEADAKGHQTRLRQISRLATHPVYGWPILLAVLFVVYKFVGEFGAGTLVGFMEKTVFGQWINPLATKLIDAILPLAFVHDLLVGKYGLITMALAYGLAIVLPIVSTFFIVFSILEDTGYLPRLAVMLNRGFKMMGLNGKAVLPMVLGLGCDTMATMTTRILETRKERLLVTLLLALGVPCSAQIGVIMGMLGIVSLPAALLWGSVVIGTMLAVGLLGARLLPGERSDFILELPPLRKPQLGNIVIKTLARLEWYLKEVLPLFILGTLILFALDKTGLLVVIERLASPVVVGLLGLPPEAAGAFLIGFLRRDYGAAGLFALALGGKMNSNQVVVSLIVITLFIPCIANVLMIIKEYGGRVALGVAGIVFPLAFAVGGVVNLALNVFHIVI